MSERNQSNKSAARAYWAAVDAATPEALASVAQAHLASEVVWQGFAPVSAARGPDGVAHDVLAPLRAAFPDLRRETHILMGGMSNGRGTGGGDDRHWVGATGYLHGQQVGDLWGIPARRQKLRLRWGEFLEFDDAGRIVRIQCLIDVIDWLEQIGLSPLPAPRGVPFVYPAPTATDGVMIEAQGDASDLLDYARRFIFGGLNGFDKTDLSSMGMADYFHPNLKWYGPGGIGACLSFQEFEDLHQRPWLVAFPDRRVQDLDNLIAEGRLVGGSSLPGVIATQTGPYLGHAASGMSLGINGLDFWLYEGGRFTENWVFVDMIHLFAQMGVNLMARVHHMARA